MTEPNTVPQPSRWKSVTAWIVIANVAVYVLNLLTMEVVTTPYGQTVTQGLLFDAGNFNYAQGLLGMQVYRLLTFQFLHNPHGIAHIAFNMLMLWTLAPVVEARLKGLRFLAFYLASGAAGPVMLVLLNRLGVLLDPNWMTQPLVGASAGVFGVMVAAAYIAPRDEIELIFPPIPMMLKQFVGIMLVVACVVVFGSGYQAQRNNAGGEAAHLGGAVVGYFLIRRMLA